MRGTPDLGLCKVFIVKASQVSPYTKPTGTILEAILLFHQARWRQQWSGQKNSVVRIQQPARFRPGQSPQPISRGQQVPPEGRLAGSGKIRLTALPQDFPGGLLDGRGEFAGLEHLHIAAPT